MGVAIFDEVLMMSLLTDRLRREQAGSASRKGGRTISPATRALHYFMVLPGVLSALTSR
jgi:hypothetical protein